MIICRRRFLDTFGLGLIATTLVGQAPIASAQQPHPACRGMRQGNPQFATLGCRTTGGASTHPTQQQRPSNNAVVQQPRRPNDTLIQQPHPACRGMRQGNPQFATLGCRTTGGAGSR